MASNALVRITNNTPTNRAYEVDINKPVKFVCKLILPVDDPVEIEIETIIPMVLFDREFQNDVANSNITLLFVFNTSNPGAPASTAVNYLENIRQFLLQNTGPGGWVTA